jgi:mycoredoxin
VHGPVLSLCHLEADPHAAPQLHWWTGGYVSHPTVYIGGEVLVDLTLRELDWALTHSNLR